jgi:dihydroorotate dehydrogenase (NAD+) catalytic subunit
LGPKQGNKGVRIWETPSGLLNSIGLENPGIPYFLENELPNLCKMGPVIIANLSGADTDEYVEGAKLLNESAVDMIELNISCPNVKAGGIAFGLDPGTAAVLVSNVKRVCTKKPVMVKLSPTAPSIAAIALSCIKAGADALSLVNTFKAMAIDTKTRKPVFDLISAGLSGPAVKPLVLRLIWEIYDTIKEAKANVPIIGLGGIANTEDAIEFLMAGSDAIQVGSATFAHPQTMTEIIDGLHKYMSDNNIYSVKDISIRNNYGKSN